ncbi:MAG: deoC [Gammaproteobacteria bacterium]|jgi:deoxyribose-phosphate aldolase|nr:deoC [Gammaproteobacteria bacterium]
MNRHQQVARLVLSLIDLTSLNETDTDEHIKSLCEKAHSDKGHVAAVCVYPPFVKTAMSCLRLTGISVATVMNFPSGNHSLEETCSHIEKSISQGAAEIDVVMPYQRYQRGDRDHACEFIKACKNTCGEKARLKVILETGYLLDPDLIERAALDAIHSGADFIKTSTGKISIGATVSAAEAICSAIHQHFEETGRKVGFKASGSIRFMAQTLPFLEIVDTILGEEWLHPETCRFGASTLLDDVLAQL